MSSHNDRSTSQYKIKHMMSTTIFDFNRCIEHLEEILRMKIVRSRNRQTFLDAHELYFDDNETTPACDVLW